MSTADPKPLLAREHTVIAVDYRGAGDSSAPATGYDRKTMAEDLHGLVAALRLGPVVLVGHDWGAGVSYAYAALHRAEVVALVAIEGRPDGPWNATSEPYWFFGFQAIPGFAERVIAGHEAEYLEWFYRTPAFHVVPLEDREVALYECAFARPGRMRAGFEVYRTIDQDRRDNAELARTKLTVPVLAVGASQVITYTEVVNADKTNTASSVWADTAYRSAKNETFMEKNGFVSQVHRKKPKGKPMPDAMRRANAEKSKVRSRVEHVFAEQKDRMGLFIRTIGIARAKVKIGMANLVYNFKRLVFLQRVAAA